MGARGIKSAAALSVVPAQPAEDFDLFGPVPEPPAHLSEGVQEWWRAVGKEYEFDAHHWRLLQCAGEAWDRMELAREAVASGGITFRAANGDLKANPACAIERDARTAFARLVRELDLDASGPADHRRPPAIGSNRRGEG